MGRKRKQWPETVPGWDMIGHEAEWIERDGRGGKTFALPIKGVQGTFRAEGDMKFFTPRLSTREYPVHVKIHPDAGRWEANARRVIRAIEAAKAGDWKTYRSLTGFSTRRGIVIGDARNMHAIVAAQQEEVCL